MKQPKARILVVEDDPSILNGLPDVPVFNGYAAEGAAFQDKGLPPVPAMRSEAGEASL